MRDAPHRELSRRFLAVLGLAMMLAAGGACGSRALPQSELTGKVNSLAAAKDTAALATLAWDQCNHGNLQARQGCLEDFFVNLAGSDRIRVALGALTVLAAHHEEVALTGHSYTHVIGIRAWKPGGDIAAIYRECTGLFQSGCYHGALQAYLTNAGAGGTIDSARAAGLCDVIAGKPDEQWLHFQCVHAMGHGLEMVNNWDLPKALKGCDWLPSHWDRSACYGGAFMENAVASMPGGHHSAMHALEAEDSMAKHDSGMAGMAMGPGSSMQHGPDLKAITFKMRDSTDALYPCSVVDSTYQFACYQLQGGLILTEVKGDFTKAAAACDRVGPPLLRSQCYLSLGTNASGMTAQNTPKVVEDCNHGDPQYQPFCIIGAVKNYIDVTAKYQDGLRFCQAVTGDANLLQCYIAVGEEMTVLYPTDSTTRARACAEAGAAGEKGCRIGAQLPDRKSL